MEKRRAHGEESIYQRKNGLWMAQILLPSGQRKYKYAKTQKDAKDWLQKEQRAISDGLVVVNEKVLFGDFLDRWFEDAAKPLLRPATIAVHESVIRLHDLRHTFVSLPLSQNVPPKDVQVMAGHADFSTTMNLYGHIMPGAPVEERDFRSSFLFSFRGLQDG